MKNIIRREITINATKEKIFAAISNAEKVVKWFPETLEGQYEVGKQVVFGFGEHGKNQVHIIDSKPYYYFAYRWVPGGSHFLGDLTKVKTTLVEFTIEEIETQVCKLIVTESGFSDLPAEVAENSFKQNSGGWDFMLGRLQKFFEV